MTRRGRPRGTEKSSRGSPVQETRQEMIPKLQIDRVRTWLKYGMTVGQAADACGVSVSELTDVLRPSA
jgi:hypothetical protein